MDTIINYFSRVTQENWLIVSIELMLIGLVVYWVVNFLEGTRGERLFHSVIFILIFGVLILKLFVSQFGFERLEHLYQGFLVGVLIIAVTAFQPEIRRALIQIGQMRFTPTSSRQLSRTMEEIIDAVKDFSAKRTGVLIVIEKRIALGELIDTGIKIDGRVSTELLKTIFYPGTPLHDMAVVIRGDRIVAASVQLPLAEAESIKSVELGSRHRAALGIARGSDANVIIVSEETGIISVTIKGELVRNVSESDLRKYLTDTLDEKMATAGSGKSAI